MKRMIVFCEGSTEEDFVDDVLAPFLWDVNVAATPVNLGGVSKYSRIKRELNQLCKSNKTALITTMFDFYGLPNETPGKSTARNSIYEAAEHIESAIESDLGNLSNLVVNVTLHEFEGLLFSQISAFGSIANEKQLAALDAVIKGFETPEHINDSFETTPSRRILSVIPDYTKRYDGITIAKQIGIKGISNKCRHFAKWLEKLTAWAKEGRL